MKKWYLTFQYNGKGRGNLELRQDSLIAMSIPARTGSMHDTDKDGDLDPVNFIKPREWFILLPPVDTTEEAMIITDGHGMKVRLYNPGWTHYLIHYDSGKPGTKGCIGTLKGLETIALMGRIAEILQIQKTISVYVNIPPTAEKPEEDQVPQYKNKENLQGAMRKGALVGAASIASAIIAANTGVDEIIGKAGIHADVVMIPVLSFIFSAIKGLVIHKMGLGRLKWLF